MICTKCNSETKGSLFSVVTVQEKSGLIAKPKRFAISLCYKCAEVFISLLWDCLDHDDEIRTTKKYGKEISTTNVMYSRRMQDAKFRFCRLTKSSNTKTSRRIQRKSKSTS